MTVGRVHARKDHQTLVRLMADVRELAGASAARLLGDGQYALLVGVGDCRALGDVLLQLLIVEELREGLGQAGPIRAMDFAPAAIAHRYLQLGGLTP